MFSSLGFCNPGQLPCLLSLSDFPDFPSEVLESLCCFFHAKIKMVCPLGVLSRVAARRSRDELKVHVGPFFFFFFSCDLCLRKPLAARQPL